MSADDSTTRPLKRARLSPAQDISPRHASPSAVPLTNLERHPEFWFDDGNIILITPKSMGFRIFRGLLAAQSTVFADMFASSSASADETFDGCPVVHVTDSHHDLVYLFRVLLPTSSHIKYHSQSDPENVPSFDEIAAVIRLAHKYHIPPVEEQALRMLQAHYFPRDFDVYCNIAPQGTQPIQCITAVNLARLTNTPHILPSALYVCCYVGGKLVDGRTHEDGTVEHLATDDLRRCFDARIALDRELALLPSRIFASVPPDRCNEPGKRCSPHIVALASNPILVMIRPDHKLAISKRLGGLKTNSKLGSYPSY
ncbi:hypothetical protein GSI_12295 [Ganoderma sinense ZZ0214-1]|uniref:BTB domain-containing protein n=1 Tax=Ganoderma sinense ZZ0214-1 TaxID=1077348 RepID=A0A2G8RYH6_9APHY|nr:hypothetical protein GSI_12295 [Ganoderma sinense ZZ0214-1]